MEGLGESEFRSRVRDLHAYSLLEYKDPRIFSHHSSSMANAR